MIVTKAQITSFFEPKKLAIAGVSSNEKKFGHSIFKELLEKDFEVLPINPKYEEIKGVKCYKSVKDLPTGIDSLLIVTPKEQTDEILREAITRGIKNIWVQQMSETEQTIKIAEEYQKEIIFNKCAFMFAEPVAGFHKFHRTIMKVFGKLPK
ncbi:MAG: CoA-binding protein [Bacteroidales bacterium]|nr:CoA-binding protein [Bacteroidales bacterium]